ncbi:MAG: MlaD family protein [Phycisphaerales bacterium]
MKPTSRDAMIGLTTIGGLLVLAWMLLRFGELAGVGQTFKTFSLRVESARGVSQVSPVTFNGVRVGDVTAIRLAEDGSGDALIDLRVREETRIPTDFRVFLDASFVGEAVVDLIGRPTNDAEVVRGEGEVYTVELGSLTAGLTEELSSRLDSFERTASKVEELAETYTDVGRRLAVVLDSDEPGDRDLRSTLERIEAVLSQAESWLDEGALLADVREAIDRFEASAEAIGDETRALRERTETTLDAADRALVSLDEAGSHMTELVTRINRGEGTLGQLATNPDLFNSLTATVEQLQALLKEARLLVEKYRDEGVTVDVF